MKDKIFIVIFLVSAIVTESCNSNSVKKAENQFTKYSNGDIKKVITSLSNDTVDEKCIEYYENGKVKSEYFIKNKLYEGYNKNYYPNGMLDFEGRWYKGRKKGLFKYYDTTGVLSKIIEFITFRDCTESKPNQIIYFKSNGDTLVSKSNYYEFYSTRDTIEYGENSYTFKFVLKGNIQKHSYFSICSLDNNFNLLSKNSCPMIKMENHAITLSPSQYKYGENIIRGYIANTELPIKADGTLEGKAAEYFFEIKFYVVGINHDIPK